MKLNRREFGIASGVSLSAILSGCSALEDDSDGGEGNGTNWDVEDGNESDADDSDSSADADSSAEGGNETESDEQRMHEDESVAGTILLSDDAEARIEVVRHTFTWLGEGPSERCHVHVMLENTSDAELTIDMEARIYDEEGTELASSTDADVEGPEPGEDDAVYSLELGDCEGTAEYEFGIADVHGDGVDERDDSGTQDDADEPDEPDELDEGDEGDEEDEVGDGEDEDDESDDDQDGDEDGQNGDGDGDDKEDDGDDEDDADEGDEDDSNDEDDEEGGETNLLRVIVQDGDGNPIDHATVDVDEGGWSETQTVDSQGRAEFDVEDGEYALTVEADGYPTLEEDVEIDASVAYTVTLRSSN